MKKIILKKGIFCLHLNFFNTLLYTIVFSFTLLSFAGCQQKDQNLDTNNLFTNTSRSIPMSSINKKQSNIIASALLDQRYVYVDLELLNDNAFNQKEGAEISLNLLKGVIYTAVKDRVEVRSETQYTWVGHIKDMNMSQVIFIVHNETLTGNISLIEDYYQIRHIENRIHYIYKIDLSAFPEEMPPKAIKIEPKVNFNIANTAKLSDNGTFIDLMVVYTPAAAKGSGNIEAEIQLAIDETNVAYANSSIHQRIRLVHTAEIDYVESGDISTDLDRLTNVDGYMDNIHTLRNEYNADIVAMYIEETNNYCGVGWLMSQITPQFEAWAFNVSVRSCPTYVLSHELGHNMGAAHNRQNSETSGVFSYSHGYQDPGHFRTIMAYNCLANDCPTVPYFSNPSIIYSGRPIGIPDGQIGSADVSKTINNTAYTVANFRQSALLTNSVSISPGSGNYGTTQRFDLALITESPGLNATVTNVTWNGVDVTLGFNGCATKGTLASGGSVSRCPNLSGEFLGKGSHNISVIITLSDGTQVSDSVIWLVKGNVEP